MDEEKHLPQIYGQTQGESGLPRPVHSQWGQQLLTMTSGANYQDRAQHIGDNIFSPLSSLETAIEQIKKAGREDNQLIDIIEDLADYITVNPERKIIGLEEKLKRAGRSELFERAKELKNKFARRVARNQMSKTEQDVYIQILAAINTTWHQVIRPQIIAGATSQMIDQLIFDKLIQPVHQAIVRFDRTITTEAVCGMLYFLTGKCHLRWEA